MTFEEVVCSMVQLQPSLNLTHIIIIVVILSTFSINVMDDVLILMFVRAH